MGAPTATVNFSAKMVNTDAAAVGQVLINTGTAFVVATSANRALYGNADGIVITPSTIGGSAIMVTCGRVDNAITGLGAGTRSYVRVSATGGVERCSPAPGDDVVGYCEVNGDLHALFGVLTAGIVTGSNPSQGAAGTIQVSDGASLFNGATNVLAGSGFITIGDGSSPNPSTGGLRTPNGFEWTTMDGTGGSLSTNERVVASIQYDLPDGDLDLIMFGGPYPFNAARTINELGFVSKQDMSFSLLPASGSGSGGAQFDFYSDATSPSQNDFSWVFFGNTNFAIQANGGASTSQLYANGVGVFGFGNAITVPSTNPTGGIILYVQSNVLKYRKPDGTIVTLSGAAAVGSANEVQVTDGSGNFAAASNVRGYSGYLEIGSGTISGTGSIRLPNNTVALSAKNNAGGADMALITTNGGDELIIGTDASFAKPTSLTRVYGFNGGLLGAQGAQFIQWLISPNRILFTYPCYGSSGTPYGVHGGVEVDIAAANHTISSSEETYTDILIKNTSTFGNHTVTWPNPSSDASGYWKLVDNVTECEQLMTMGGGSDYILNPAESAVLRFDGDGIHKVGAPTGGYAVSVPNSSDYELGDVASHALVIEVETDTNGAEGQNILFNGPNALTTANGPVPRCARIFKNINATNSINVANSSLGTGAGVVNIAAGASAWLVFGVDIAVYKVG